MAIRPKRFKQAKRFARDENEDTELAEYVAQLSQEDRQALFELLSQEFGDADSDEDELYRDRDQNQGTGARADDPDANAQDRRRSKSYAADALAMDAKGRVSFARRFPDAARVTVR